MLKSGVSEHIKVKFRYICYDRFVTKMSEGKNNFSGSQFSWINEKQVAGNKASILGMS